MPAPTRRVLSWTIASTLLFWAVLQPLLHINQYLFPDSTTILTGPHMHLHHAQAHPPYSQGTLSSPLHYPRTVSYVCAAYEDYLLWSHNFYVPSFYSIIGIAEPTKQEPFESVQTRVLAAWWRFQESKEAAQVDNIHGAQDMGEDKIAMDEADTKGSAHGVGDQEETQEFFSSKAAPETSWGESLTEARIWSQVVHVLLDERASKIYNDVFMALIRNSEQLATQCQWEM